MNENIRRKLKRLNRKSRKKEKCNKNVKKLHKEMLTSVN